jgi:hypothetical protein
MYIVIKGGKPTDWYSCHQGLKYKVVHEGHEGYLVESQAMGEAWRIVAKDDCEKTDDELFCQQVKQPDAHYDNTHGSLYKFAEEHGLNAYEFEIIKRTVRCRKKGEFISDIEKTIRVLNIYLDEQRENYVGQVEKLNGL